MSLIPIAKETLDIVERGEYLAPSGRSVSIRDMADRAARGTILYRPEQLDQILRKLEGISSQRSFRIEVTAETTAEASRRLIEAEGEQRVAALNFASALNPGGGFLGGAKAQEEDLARASALYHCLFTQLEYYQVNRASDSHLYTDYIIYSPEVPFFRNDRLELLEKPFSVSIITAPAPNAGPHLSKYPNSHSELHAALHMRAGKVLAVAVDRCHRCLVLGAWGCGAFKNNPQEMAEIFSHWLSNPKFANAFDRIVFAVYDRSPTQGTLRTFQNTFPPASCSGK